MTADEFRAALVRLDLSHHQAAERLGMGRHGWQSVRDWARGDRDVPGPVALALQLLLERDSFIPLPITDVERIEIDVSTIGSEPRTVPGIVEYVFYLTAEWPNALGEQPDDLIGRRVRQGDLEYEILSRQGDRYTCSAPF